MISDRPQSAISHRKEIDGLRALAVLPVLFFHFSLPGFSGGFVGVDIFFVISGFLIGGILWSELSETGTLRLGRFFLRRIRRLAPAYFAMALATLAVAYFVLLPFEFREFGKELIASTVYLSNVHFFRSAGYFDVAAEQKLLLHTWSLAVEEQFYIFLPFFLILFRSFRAILPAVLIGLGLVSLLACLVITPISQTAAFYLFPFRAWELLAGVCLAILGQKYQAEWSFHSLISWAGLALIVGSILLIPSGESFPGYFALFPVAGTLLILMNGRHDNLVNRLLTHPLAIFFGLISYSLYLWHWPVITIAHYYLDGEISFAARLLLAGVSIALAWLSLKLVETPIRKGFLKAPVLLGAAFVGSLVTLGTGGWIYVQDGLVNRFPENIRTHIDASGDFLQDWSRCRTSAQGIFAGIEVCPIGPEGNPQFIVWGDSHVRAFKEGLDLAAHENGVPGLIIWRAGCPPFFDIGKKENTSTHAQNQACQDANQQLRQVFSNLDGVETLLLIGRWAYYAQGHGVGLDKEDTIELFALPRGPLAQSDPSLLYETAWEHSVDILSERFRDIFVLQQVPEIPGYAAPSVARRLAHGHLKDGADLQEVTQLPRSAAWARAARGHDAIIRAAQKSDAQVISSWNGLCDQSICSAMFDGKAGYFDSNHITNTTARRLRGIFDPVFQAAKGIE